MELTVERIIVQSDIPWFKEITGLYIISLEVLKKLNSRSVAQPHECVSLHF